ncbi:MAG: leucyl aminopeptidase [Patescibacteria group bacterium]|nr:leucyl aminopeptidase [Patescibacteria group bacterium]
MMNFSASKLFPSGNAADLLVLPMFEESLKLGSHWKKLDPKVDELLQDAIASGDFRGKTQEILTVFLTSEKFPRRLALLGLGKKAEFTLEGSRKAVAILAPLLHKHRIKKIAVQLPLELPKNARSVEEATAAVVEGLLLSLYQFHEYKKPDPGAPLTKLENVWFVLNRPTERVKVLSGAKQGELLAEAVNYTRDLANHPGNVMTPATLASEAKTLARKFHLHCQVLEKADLKRLGMNALLAVNQGSALPPKFIILQYQGTKTESPTVLVGKGITFDSGGISLKPGKAMDEMKFDMCGAAAVLGTIRAAAELKLPRRLIGLIPATENLPSGTASRPGDVVKALSGKTIEILNTDAEGRMILADALAYAARYKPELVIDIATLTGACVVALGTDYAGAFSTDKKLLTKLQAAGDKTGEKIWPLPLAPEYKEDIKSSVADIKNLGLEGKGGGTITAALFLQEFVSYPWMHLDIAGTAWTTSGKSYYGKGATGYGVRLMLEFLK